MWRVLCVPHLLLGKLKLIKASNVSNGADYWDKWVNMLWTVRLIEGWQVKLKVKITQADSGMIHAYLATAATWRKQAKQMENGSIYEAKTTESVRLCVWLEAMQWEHNTSKKNTSLLPFYFRDTAYVSVNTEEPGRAARKRVRLVALTCQIASERFRGQSRWCFQSNSAWKSS